MLHQRNARAYCRVSTTMQSELGTSLGVQQQRIQEYCNYKNLKLVEVYEDAGISGKNMKRPGLQRILSEINKDETLIITELSRLSRNTTDAMNIFDNLRKKGAYLVCLSPDIDFSTPAGELIFTMLVAFHRLEQQNISMHVSNNIKTLVSEKKLRSQVPFGYRFISREKGSEKSVAQQKVIRKIKLLYGEGKTFYVIAKELNKNGDNIVLLENKKLKPIIPGEKYEYKIPMFYPNMIKKILENEGLLE